jgi:hypothetical protein
MKLSSKLGVLGCVVLGGAVVACSGSDGAQGPAGKDGVTGPAGSAGPGGDPSVSGITPGRAFLARKVDVTVSGYNTEWSTSTTLDFGAAIKVDSITVASPTALVASLTIDKAATPGARDVTITDGSTKEVYKGAFKLDLPAVISTQGSVAQGSILAIHVTGKDLSTPFDTTSTGDGLFTPITFTNLSVTAPAGVNASVDAATIYGVDMTALVDVTAPTTAQALEVTSGPMGDPKDDVFPMPGVLTLAARTPAALTSGTAATGTIAKPLDSMLYSFTPGASLSIVDFAASSTVMNATPKVVILPKSGKFADLVTFAAKPTIVTASADPYYAIYWDNSGTTGAFSVLAKSVAATGAAPMEPNDTFAQAQTAATLPFVLRSAALTSATDIDYVKYTALAADVGKSFHVQTIAGDPKTDTIVDVFATDTTTSLGGPSADTGYHEDFVSSPITAAGVYYVKFAASPQGYSTSHTSYVGIVRLQ